MPLTSLPDQEGKARLYNYPAIRALNEGFLFQQRGRGDYNSEWVKLVTNRRQRDNVSL